MLNDARCMNSETAIGPQLKTPSAAANVEHFCTYGFKNDFIYTLSSLKVGSLKLGIRKGRILEGGPGTYFEERSVLMGPNLHNNPCKDICQAAESLWVVANASAIEMLAF